jgi:hypothetical protein
VVLLSVILLTVSVVAKLTRDSSTIIVQNKNSLHYLGAVITFFFTNLLLKNIFFKYYVHKNFKTQYRIASIVTTTQIRTAAMFALLMIGSSIH